MGSASDVPRMGHSWWLSRVTPEADLRQRLRVSPSEPASHIFKSLYISGGKEVKSCNDNDKNS